jgi:hypothetical protein
MGLKSSVYPKYGCLGFAKTTLYDSLPCVVLHNKTIWKEVIIFFKKVWKEMAFIINAPYDRMGDLSLSTPLAVTGQGDQKKVYRMVNKATVAQVKSHNLIPEPAYVIK